MKLYPLLFILWLNAVYPQAKQLSGQIKEAGSDSALAYVTIGIKSRSCGTISDEKGRFILKFTENVTATDSVTISHIGYITLKIKIADFKSDTPVVMHTAPDVLNEVAINFKKPKNRKFGRTAKGFGLMHFNFYSHFDKEVDDALSREVGMKLKVQGNCRINALKFNVTSNEFRSLKFRLHFYSIVNGLPADLIVNKEIIFNVKNGFLGWFTVDLRPYEIYLDEDIKEVAVTIQWLESEKLDKASKFFTISTALSATETSFYREKALDGWESNDQSLSFYLDAMCQ